MSLSNLLAVRWPVAKMEISMSVEEEEERLAKKRATHNAWQRKRRSKGREVHGRAKHARDTTRIMQLTENQVLNLYDQIVACDIQTHDLDDDWEEFHCHSDPSLTFNVRAAGRGYGWYQTIEA